jgi:hypothetical protein
LTAFIGLGRFGAALSLREAIQKIESRLSGENSEKIAKQKTNVFALHLQVGASMPN